MPSLQKKTINSNNKFISTEIKKMSKLEKIKDEQLLQVK